MLTLGSHVRFAAFYRFGGFLMTIASMKSKAVGDVLAANNVQTRLGEEGRMIGQMHWVSAEVTSASKRGRPVFRMTQRPTGQQPKLSAPGKQGLS
jgi:hypothetical protein